jgi:transposase InsO family protein
VIRVLVAVWEAAGYPWSVRLKALLPAWLPWARKRFALSAKLESQVLAISPRQIDRRLREHKRKIKKRLYGWTKPGTLLEHQVPIKTDRWDVAVPGFTEIDLVSHSGNNASGEFLHSLNVTDIHSGWTETRAVMGKAQVRVQQALDSVRTELPFPLLGIDSDNGSEFLNAHLVRYCRASDIQFTRGRPYKKDDNAHVEQKNWTHVRKLLGYERYDSETALLAINKLYQGELRLLQNLFMPSVKLLRKERVGSRIRRHYDQARTPLERVMACPKTHPLVVARLAALRDRLDPFALSRSVDAQLERIHALANHCHSPAVGRSAKAS